jgi:hypothetical protein
MGPILTTGVALVAAAVVVANPVAPPVRDLQISTTQLSTNPEALIPFDKNLLKSISQPSAASTFNAALAQILGALAAEADRIGTEVNSDVSMPLAPTASASQATPVYAPLSADVPPGATSNGTPSASTTVLPAASTPTMEQVVAEVTADTAYLGNKVVEAAYAAVNALVSTPDLIFQAVQAVLIGDLATAFATIVQAVKAFFSPGLILVGGIDDVVGQFGAPPTSSPASASAAATNYSRIVAPLATAVGARRSATDLEPAAEPGNGKPRQTKSTGSAGHAITDGASQLTARSSASAPGAGNSSRSADSAEQPKPKASGADKPGSASSGTSHNASARGASAGN